MIKAIVNQEHQYDIESQSKIEEVLINNVFEQYEVSKISKDIYQLKKNGKNYEIRLIAYNSSLKQFKLKVNGTLYEVDLKDRIDFFLEAQGMTDLTKVVINDLKAPMPGLVLDIKVNAGDDVKEGDALFILEAMKMENVIKSPTHSKIKSINVTKGQAVEKNQLLIEFDN